MNKNQTLEKWVNKEFKEVAPNLIWQNRRGEYQAFGRYRIIPESTGFRVFASLTETGVFNSTRTAISWCVADKFQRFDLAQQILNLDARLNNLNNDIATRAGIAEYSRNAFFKETVVTKLESKIIQRKEVEAQLDKCVKWAKYLQQRGFNK